MGQKANVLDALAWAGVSESARVARIAAKLVRELHQYKDEHTKTRIKDAVRATSPPYGRGKYIIAAVDAEYQRQLPIYKERKAKHDAWAEYQKHIVKRSTRVNNAYAAAFDRPQYHPKQRWGGSWGDYDGRQAFDEVEGARDFGDRCLALTHQGNHVVALLTSKNGQDGFHIATRLKRGTVTRTYLRGNDDQGPQNLIDALVSLGGPQVKAALAIGKQVETDWVGRRSFIHHDGRDHQAVGVEEISWRARMFEEVAGYHGRTNLSPYPVIVHGESVMRDTKVIAGRVLRIERPVDVVVFVNEAWNDVDR
jgi:hypothetical protein